MMQLTPIRSDMAGRSGAEIFDFARAAAMKQASLHAAAALADIRAGSGSAASLMRVLVAPFNEPARF